jgi:ABC-type amino acid transport substrate-binding protein
LNTEDPREKEKTMKSWKWLAVFLMLFGTATGAEQSFSSLVGPVTVQDVSTTKPTTVPYITWGGDVAAFYANGTSLTTTPSSIYGKLGLNLKFVNGDDFIQQTKSYMTGKTPYIRGTFRMLGQASEVLGSDPRTKPVVILQLTWSLGDHIVAKEEIKTLNDLKGKKICLQQGGPHVGLMQDTLDAASLTWDDVTIVWAKDLSGPNGPAEMMRKDKTIDAACVITPDMIGLCSGLDQKGSGAEGTIKGAHVVNSTSTMSRSIADVWAVRSDYFKSNRADVEKFVAGYFKGTEDLVKMRDAYDSSSSFTQGTGPTYKKLLQFAQKTFGEEVIPTLEEDGHGLLLDASFVGLPGNISFFTDAGNLNGFEAKQKAALDLATGRGYASERRGFSPPGFDYQSIASVAGIAYKAPKKQSGRIDAESLDMFPDSGELDANTIVSFTISFQPNQTSFSADTYGSEFERAIKSASTFGNAVVAVRGHADPNKVLADLVRAGMAKGVIKRSGSKGNYKYFLNNKPLDLSQTQTIIDLVKSGAFDGTSPNPRETMQAALNLSQARAAAVKKAVVNFAKTKSINLDDSQIQPVGVGIAEPLIARPKCAADALQNMRVEFRIVKVPAESINQEDFDF